MLDTQVEYFVNGGIQRIKERKIERRGQVDKGFLLPPSRYEVIFLANPIIAIGSPSFAKYKEDNNSVYAMLQIIGIDIHSEDFERYFGFSLFHASPINLDLEFFTRPLIGLEAHYKHNVNMGMGIEYPKFKTGEPSNYAVKAFLSVALFDAFFKKKDKAERKALL